MLPRRFQHSRERGGDLHVPPASAAGREGLVPAVCGSCSPGHTAFAFSGWKDFSLIVKVSPPTLISVSKTSFVNSLSLLSSLSTKSPASETGAVMDLFDADAGFLLWASMTPREC